MTLLYTEISPEFPGRGRCVFFAADRRISPSGRGDPMVCRKLVDIPYLNAALGFFGLAHFPRGGAVCKVTDHLRDFVRAHHNTRILSDPATSLADSLNSFIPSSLRKLHRSGVHLAGFNSHSLPEFWYVRNVDDTGQPTLGQYEAREEFLARDARANGYDGSDPDTLPSVSTFYRNGDIVSHVVAWKSFDNTLGRLLRVPQFCRVRTPEEYSKWIRFKMEVLVHFHKRFEKTLLVGGPIDTIAKCQHDA